ncbi:MAG TPA: hypothetical protein QGF58_04210 [Myxococcota bacterium]|nr:hypothetical protein [Myxococcota bacterium]
MTSLVLLLACKGDDPVQPTPDETGIEPACAETVEPPDGLVAGEWAEATPPPAGGIVSIIADDLTGTVYAASHNAGAWRSDHEGEHWEALPVFTSHTMADLYAPPGQADVLFRSSGGFLEVSRDGGRGWEQAGGQVDLDGHVVVGIGGAAHDGQAIYVAAHDGWVWVSEDGGASFANTGKTGLSADPMAIMRQHPVGWRLLGEAEEGGPSLLAHPDGVQLSADGLATWDTTLEAVNGDLVSTSFVRNPTDPEVVVIGASTGDLYSSEDGGLTWTMQETGAVELGAAGFSADGSTLYLAAAESFLASTDGGGTWIEGPFEGPGALLALASGRVLVADDEGMEASDDEGVTWSPADNGLDDLGISVLTPDPVCANRLIIGSRCTGGMFRTEDWGQSWVHVHGPTHFHYVMGVHHDPQDPTRVWAVSDDTLVESRDRGVSWELRYSRVHFHGFAAHPDDGDVLLLGSVGSGKYGDEVGVVEWSVDGGQAWVDSSTGIPDSEASMHTIIHWPGTPDVVILGTYRGGSVSHTTGEGIGMFRSVDGGRIWSAIDLDVSEVSWLAALEGGVAAATDDGLWISKDEGLVWTRSEGPTGFLLSADFDGALGFVLNQEGQLWRTDDAGDTWTEVSPEGYWDTDNTLARVAIGPEGSGVRLVWLTYYDHAILYMPL